MLFIYDLLIYELRFLLTKKKIEKQSELWAHQICTAMTSVDLRRDAALFIDRTTDSLAVIPKDTCYLMIRETPLRYVFKG